MTALCYLLASGLVGAVAAVAVMSYYLVTGLKSERASFAAEILAGKAQLAAERNQLTAENERDTEKAGRVKAEAERDQALAQLKSTQAALAQAQEKAAADVADKVLTAPSPATELDRVLKESDRTGSNPGQPGADSGGAAKPDAVRVASLAATDLP